MSDLDVALSFCGLTKYSNFPGTPFAFSGNEIQGNASHEFGGWGEGGTNSVSRAVFSRVRRGRADDGEWFKSFYIH